MLVCESQCALKGFTQRLAFGTKGILIALLLIIFASVGLGWLWGRSYRQTKIAERNHYLADAWNCLFR